MNRILALVVCGMLMVVALGSYQPQPEQVTVKPVVVRITIAELEAAPKLSDVELECLKRNIFHEARNQTVAGMQAVAFVTINRTRTKHYPKTVCGVVEQYVQTKRGKVCQFSWMCDGKADVPDLKHPGDAEAWATADSIARNVLSSNADTFLEGATHYHATYVDPYWAHAKRFKRLQQIGTHIFYRDVKLALRDA